MQKQDYKCLYCKKSFSAKDPANFEHLDNNPANNEDWNIALAHVTCNNQKKNNYDYQIIANEQIKKNQEELLSVRKIEEIDGLELRSTELEISKQTFRITEQWITERVQIDGHVLLSDAINCAGYRCRKLTGEGAEITIRRHINQLTCAEGPFMIIRNDSGKRTIVKRTEN